VEFYSNFYFKKYFSIFPSLPYLLGTPILEVGEKVDRGHDRGRTREGVMFSGDAAKQAW